jgi:aminodeoxyfutalosine deaminase
LYRKFTADQIFTGYEILPEPAVLICNADGQVLDLVPITDAGDDVMYNPGMLSPGFVNAHCHLELSHLIGKIPKGTGLVGFVQQVMSLRNSNEEEIAAAMEMAEASMLNAGIVAVGDICNSSDSIGQKLKEQLYYHNFIEAAGFPPEAAAIRFETAEKIYQLFREKNLPANIVPHAPYSVSVSLLNKMIDFEGNDRLSLHNQEDEAEEQLFYNGEGALIDFYRQLNIDISFFNPPRTSSLQYLLPYFKAYRPLILVHNVFTSEADLRFANELFPFVSAPLYFCLCANANLYINNRLPDIDRLIKHQCNLVLGTDSLASNDQLSIMEEINTISKHFPQLPLAVMLRWATSNGAAALGVDHWAGSFGKGKKPGVISIHEGNVKRLI